MPSSCFGSNPRLEAGGISVLRFLARLAQKTSDVPEGLDPLSLLTRPLGAFAAEVSLVPRARELLVWPHASAHPAVVPHHCLLGPSQRLGSAAHASGTLHHSPRSRLE